MTIIHFTLKLRPHSNNEPHTKKWPYRTVIVTCMIPISLQLRARYLLLFFCSLHLQVVFKTVLCSSHKTSHNVVIHYPLGNHYTYQSPLHTKIWPNRTVIVACMTPISLQLRAWYLLLFFCSLHLQVAFKTALCSSHKTSHNVVIHYPLGNHYT